MEGREVARRRISKIAGHFVPADDTVCATHLLPLNCFGSLNSVIRRYDNRMFFARQGSTSQGCYMRQISSEQGTETQCGAPLKCLNSVTGFTLDIFGAPLFSRPAITEPLFSRPAMTEQNCSNIFQDQLRGGECRSSMSDPSKFAQQDKREEMSFCSRNNMCSSESNGGKWLPRMDIAESGSKYVMMLEIPGVNVNDIRVEIDEQHLRVTGQRSAEYWNISGCSGDPISEYHKREISRGSCQFVWPLPNNANKDGVSAEFLNGLLQVIIPKV